MGLAALRRILHPRPCEVNAFSGRAVAVDANNLVWSFTTAMAAGGALPTGPDGRSIAHLIGLVNRLRFYAQHDIRSAWVFDGDQPALKDATIAGRWARIEAARADGNEQAGVSVEREDLEEVRQVLDALGVPWLDAPGESDPQCAHLAREGHVHAAVTQDYDAALHGSPLTVRNLTASKTRAAETLDLATALAQEAITREQLVDAAVLIGTDYNDGVKGVGPVKALKLVKKHGDVHAALEALDVAMPEAEAVRQLFLDHPVDASWRPAFRAPDGARVQKLLERAGLSDARAEAVVESIARLHA